MAGTGGHSITGTALTTQQQHSNQSKDSQRKMKKSEGYYKETKRAFLLSFFEEESGYCEKQINGFWLIKSWNGDGNFWQVSIFTPESYERYKCPTDNQSFFEL